MNLYKTHDDAKQATNLQESAEVAADLQDESRIAGGVNESLSAKT